MIAPHPGVLAPPRATQTGIAAIARRGISQRVAPVRAPEPLRTRDQGEARNRQAGRQSVNQRRPRVRKPACPAALSKCWGMTPYGDGAAGDGYPSTARGHLSNRGDRHRDRSVPFVLSAKDTRYRR